MALKIKKSVFNSTFETLKEIYVIYAPKRFPKEGRFVDTYIVRYDLVDRAEEIVFDTKSDYAVKEVLSPITETLFYFTDDEYREKKIDQKPILIFARACPTSAWVRPEKNYTE